MTKSVRGKGDRRRNGRRDHTLEGWGKNGATDTAQAVPRARAVYRRYMADRSRYTPSFRGSAAKAATRLRPDTRAPARRRPERSRTLEARRERPTHAGGTGGRLRQQQRVQRSAPRKRAEAILRRRTHKRHTCNGIRVVRGARGSDQLRVKGRGVRVGRVVDLTFSQPS